MNRVACALAMIALAACARKPMTFARRQLPGMSIELPASPAIRSIREQIEYRAGEITLRGDVDGQVLVTVQWEPHKPTGDEQQQAMLGLGVVGPTERVTGIRGPSGEPADTVQLIAKGTPVLASGVQCGGRSVRILSVSPREQRELHQHVVASVLCAPDPREEERLKDIPMPLGLSLPGWYTVSREGGILRLGTDDSTLMLRPMPPTTSDDVGKALGPLLQQAFKGGLHARAGGDRRVVLSGTVDGIDVVGWARLVKCPTTSLFAIELSQDQAHADAVEAAVQAARCLRPGEPAPSWPDAPTEAPH